MSKKVLFIALIFMFATATIEALLLFMAVNIAGTYTFSDAQSAALDLLELFAQLSVPAFLMGLYFAVQWQRNLSRGRIASKTCVAAVLIALVCTNAALLFEFYQKTATSAPLPDLFDVLLSNLGNSLFASLIAGLYAFIMAHLLVALFKYRQQ